MQSKNKSINSSAFSMQYMEDSDDEKETELCQELKIKLPALSNKQPLKAAMSKEEKRLDSDWIKKEFKDYQKHRNDSAMQSPAPSKESKWQKLTFEKEKKINELQVELAQLKSALKAVQAPNEQSDSAIEPEVGKIISLARKLRNAMLALQSERDDNRKLRLELEGLRNDSVQTKDNDSVSICNGQDADQELKLKQKLNAILQKYQNEKVANQTLKTQLAQAHRLLQQEIGPDVKLSSADVLQQLANNTSWKGRAQQIIQLKQRVKLLDQTIQSSSMSVADSDSVSVSNFSEQHKVALWQEQKERRQLTERLKAELRDSYDAYDKLKTKHDAAHLRIQHLETRAKDTKTKLEILVQKTKHDDEFIKLLQQELDNVSEQKETAICQLESAHKRSASALSVNSSILPVEEQSILLKQYQETIANLRAQLDFSERAKASLEQELRQKSNSSPVPSSHSTSTFQIRQLHETIEMLKTDIQSLQLLLQNSQREKDRQAEEYEDIIQQLRLINKTTNFIESK